MIVECRRTLLNRRKASEPTKRILNVNASSSRLRIQEVASQETSPSKYPTTLHQPVSSKGHSLPIFGIFPHRLFCFLDVLYLAIARGVKASITKPIWVVYNSYDDCLPIQEIISLNAIHAGITRSSQIIKLSMAPSIRGITGRPDTTL